MASSSSSSSLSSSGQESDPKRRSEQNQFDRLPDDLLMCIINKILQGKALVRLSLVSKRFFPLVFKTDSVSIDVDNPLCLRHGNSRDPLCILKRFQQIKHLHVRYLPHGGGRLESVKKSSAVIVFGFQIGDFYLLMPQSVNKSYPSAAAGIDSIRPFPLDPSEFIVSEFDDVRNSIWRSTSEMLECIMVSDDLADVKFLVVGKEEIARFRSSHSKRNPYVGALSYSVPTLCLGELGYTMKDTIFVRVFAENHNTEQVKGVTLPPLPDQSDFEDCQVYYGAVQMLMDKITRK